jgi:hypothetical protein
MAKLILKSRLESGILNLILSSKFELTNNLKFIEKVYNVWLVRYGL